MCSIRDTNSFQYPKMIVILLLFVSIVNVHWLLLEAFIKAAVVVFIFYSRMKDIWWRAPYLSCHRRLSN